jgi:hypothetical protein
MHTTHGLCGCDCQCCALGASLCGCIYKRFVLQFASSRSAFDKRQKYITKLEEKCKKLEQDKLLPTGKAIIVFNYESHAKNMLRDHNRLPDNAYLRTCLLTLLTYAAMRRFHRATCVPS